MMDVHSRLYSLSRLCLDVIASQVPLGTNPSTLFRATSAPQVVAIPVVEAEPVLTSSAAKGVAAAQAVPASYLAASDYESSVLRIYRYSSLARPAEEAEFDIARGAHADLGLLTIAPRGTVAGLEVWDESNEDWLNAEEASEPRDCIVFAGETLGYLSNGLIRGVLHRAKPCPVCSLGKPWRMSMPFFLRAEPGARIQRTSMGESSTSIREFMENVLFSKRWWRSRPETKCQIIKKKKKRKPFTTT